MFRAAEGSVIPGQAMQVDGRVGGLPGGQPLAEQAEAESGQHVPASAGGHARVAGGVEEHGWAGDCAARGTDACAAGLADGGMGAFEHDNCAVTVGKFLLAAQAFPAVGGFSGQAFEFLGMRREDAAAFGQEFQQGGGLGQEVESVGIDD